MGLPVLVGMGLSVDVMDAVCVWLIVGEEVVVNIIVPVVGEVRVGEWDPVDDCVGERDRDDVGLCVVLLVRVVASNLRPPVRGFKPSAAMCLHWSPLGPTKKKSKSNAGKVRCFAGDAKWSKFTLGKMYS